MAVDVLDAEIQKFLPLLESSEKRSMLQRIKSLLHITDDADTANNEKAKPFSIDYDQYRFPVLAIKFDRGEINER